MGKKKYSEKYRSRFSPPLSSYDLRPVESSSSLCVEYGDFTNPQTEKDSPSLDFCGCGKNCCFNRKCSSFYGSDKSISDKKSSTRSKQPGSDISSMSGSDLRSVVQSQVVQMNILSESIAQLNDFSGKVLLDDFTDLSTTLQKDILKKMYKIISNTHSTIELLPEPKPKGLPELNAKLKAALKLADEPLLENGEIKTLLKGLTKLLSKGKPKGESNEESEEQKWLSKGELKKEPKYELNKKADEKPKGKPKENSMLKLDPKTTKENYVESEIRNRVIQPIIRRIQRAYLTNMEDHLKLINYLETMPSALVNCLKDNETLEKQEKQ